MVKHRGEFGVELQARNSTDAPVRPI